MGFNEFISKLFGNKASRDMREIQPWVEKIKAVYPTIAAMSNDELRAATQALKEKIQNTVTAERARIAELKASGLLQVDCMRCIREPNVYRFHLATQDTHGNI